MHDIRFGNGADQTGNSGEDVLFQLIFIPLYIICDDISINTLTFDFMRIPHNSRFHYISMHIYGIFQFSGAYSQLKFESGAHCVKRVPSTESQGRVHTSTATVAVLPELDEIDEVEINPADLKTDTFRASGAGGQHVNKTDSAIRITHLPTGTVVECQEERSQHKNRARAMSLLRARLLDAERSKQSAAQAESRRLQVGTGDRSQRIRTYRYKDNLVTDHRIGLNLYRLTEIMQGDLDELIDALTREYQADQLQALGNG